MPSSPQRSRSRKLLTGLVGVLSAAGLLALFGAGVVGALLLHLDLPAARRVTADLVGRLLASVLQGQLSIGSLSRVRPYEVVAEDIVVRDPARRVVLKVSRLTARADLADILKRVLRGDEKLTIIVNHVRIERAEADIIPDQDGVPTIAQAFMPRPSPPGPPSPDRGEYVRVWLPAIELGQGYARGSAVGSPTLEAEVTGVHGSVLATPKGAAIDINRFALVARGAGGADARGIAALHIRAPGAVWGSLDGYIGDVQFGGSVRFEKQELELKLDVPRAEPAAVRALLGNWPLLVDTQARVRLQGKPSAMNVDLSATFGESSTVTGRGTAQLSAPARLQMDLEGRRLDVRALSASAPATSFDVDTSLELHAEQGQPVVNVAGSLQPTKIQSLTVPAIDFEGGVEKGTFSAQAKLLDPGMPIDATVSVTQDGKIELTGEAKRVNLAKVERIRPYFEGSGSADVRARASINRDRLETSLTLDVRDFEYQGVTLRSGRVVAAAKGSLSALDQLALDARLTGKTLSAGGLSFDQVQASARGPLRSPRVTTQLLDPDGPSVDGEAVVVIGSPVQVQRLSLGVSRAGVAIRGDVAQLEVGAEHLMIRDLRLRGASGDLDGDAQLVRGELSVSAQGQNLDLSALSRVLGLPRGQLEGRASLNVNAVANRETQSGTLQLGLSRAAIANLNGISGQLSAKLDGRKLTGDATAEVESLGAFSANWDTELAGRPTERAAYEHATGRASISADRVTLDYLGQFLPSEQVDVTGTASLKLDVARSDGEAMPDLNLAGATQDLRVTIARPQQAPLVVSGIELLASASHVGQNGDTSVALGAQQGSERLLSASAALQLDLRAALEGREPLEQQVQQHPLQAKLVVSEVTLDRLPDPLRVPGLSGSLRLDGALRGSLQAPIGSLSVRAAGLRFAAGDRGEPVDVCGTAEYAKETGAFNVGGEVFLPTGLDFKAAPCTGKRVATVRWNGLMPLGEQGYQGWTGTALASLEFLPLSVLPPLADAGVSGRASGRLLLDRSADPSASAELILDTVKVDRLAIGAGTVSLRTSADRARVAFSIKDGPTSVGGELNAGITWQGELPAIDGLQPIDASLRASRLDAAALEPLLDDYLNELHGTVDGNLHARLAALGKGETARKVSSIDGKLTLRDGAFLISGLGFRLRDVGFTATATRDGERTLLDVPALTGNAGGKAQNMSAYVKLQLRGLDLEGGQARVSINKLPLVVDGVTRANADARFRVELQRQPEKMFVQIWFDSLQAKVPQENRDVIDIKGHPDVTLLQPITEPKATRDQDALPWHFVLHLGDNTKLQRGPLLDLPLRGDPNLVLAESLGVTGSIYLRRGGAVQMLGKIFIIEGGGVFFDTPDPKDPRLDVQASWRTPDNDTLFVYVTGTVSKPKLRFDRSEQAAWALLLGGDGSDITLNALDTLLAGTPLAGVQIRKTNAENDGDGGAVYTASYRVSERFIVEGNYQEAETTATEDTGGVGAAVDWRMTKSWSLRGQLGTIGTGVDIIYQYRY